MKTTLRLEQLDLAISNMDMPEAEKQAKTALESLSGIHSVRLMERGAWMEYDPARISVDRIRETLRAVGLKASVFQDSKSGKTGEVNY